VRLSFPFLQVNSFYRQHAPNSIHATESTRRAALFYAQLICKGMFCVFGTILFYMEKLKVNEMESFDYVRSVYAKSGGRNIN
jgi:hypothetical protein